MRSIMNVKTNQKGFTLIELVVVIVILGILAVTAVPKFIDLQDDAKTATLNAVKASMQTAATIVHSKSLIAGNETSATGTVDVNGVTVGIAYGYPTSAGASAATSWAALLDVPDFDILVDGTPTTVIVAPEGLYATHALAVSGNKCIATYTEASSTTVRETYVVTDC